MPLTAGQGTSQIRRVTYGQVEVLRIYEGTNPAPIWTTSRPLPPAAAPSAFTAWISATALSLTWVAVAGATGYRVRYRTGTTGAYTETDRGSSLSWSLSVFTAGLTYNVEVQAYNEGGNGPWSTIQSLLAPSLAPEPPSSAPRLTVRNATTINVNWTTSAGATAYQIRYGLASALPSTYAIQDVAITDGLSLGRRNADVTGLTASTRYRFYVRACRLLPNGTTIYSTWSGASIATTRARGPLDEPAPVLSGSLSRGLLARTTLSWTSVVGARSYQLQQQLPGSTTWRPAPDSETGTGRWSRRGASQRNWEGLFGAGNKYRVRASTASVPRFGFGGPPWSDANSGPWSNIYTAS